MKHYPADKLQKTKSKAVANNLIEYPKENNVRLNGQETSAPMAKLQDIISNSSQVKQLKAFREMAANQTTPSVIQLGKLGKKKAAIERNKNKKSKTQSLGDRSYNNLCAYRPGWVRSNNITAQNVADFRKTYKHGIRGHSSGDNTMGEQDNTKEDCLAYKSWHTKTFGVWY